jgi:two-component system phosphate regulon response regulator PhoB
MGDHILLVDDDVNTLGALGYILQRAGYHVEKATGGREALSKVAADCPRLVILDVRMPDLNGIEVCRSLRAAPDTEHLPILVLSVLDDLRSTTEALVAGANNYLLKPVRPVELVEQVRVLLYDTRPLGGSETL